jgi:hypothetical protein
MAFLEELWSLISEGYGKWLIMAAVALMLFWAPLQQGYNATFNPPTPTPLHTMLPTPMATAQATPPPTPTPLPATGIYDLSDYAGGVRDIQTGHWFTGYTGGMSTHRLNKTLYVYWSPDYLYDSTDPYLTSGGDPYYQGSQYRIEAL